MAALSSSSLLPSQEAGPPYHLLVSCPTGLSRSQINLCCGYAIKTSRQAEKRSLVFDSLRVEIIHVMPFASNTGSEEACIQVLQRILCVLLLTDRNLLSDAL
eukprot:c21103_g1_i1 orf=431-736(-)